MKKKLLSCLLFLIVCQAFAFKTSAAASETIANKVKKASENVILLNKRAAPPTINITTNKSTLRAGETATLTFTLSEASSNFEESDIDFAGGSISNFSGSGRNYTATFTPAANRASGAAVEVVDGKFTDEAGNANKASNTLIMTVNTVRPMVSGVSSNTLNGTYKIGDLIKIEVYFNENVNVTGNPTLTLKTGATDRIINYSTLISGNILIFDYIVQAGDYANDLDYVSTSALATNGGTIKSASSANDATLTLQSPSLVRSLGFNKNLVVDGIKPSVSSIVPVGGSLSTQTSVGFTVNFSEAVNNISTDDFSLAATGSAFGTISSVSASSGSSVIVTVSRITGNGTLKVNLNASTNIVDAAGNSSPATYTSGTTHTVAIPTEPSAPTIGTATAGQMHASVSFTAPANNGGSAITGYTVTASPGGITASGNDSPIMIIGLTNGTAYTFKVTATNAVGTSEASNSSNSVIPKGDQVINFNSPGTVNVNVTGRFPSSTTSGLPATFSSATPGVCSITPEGDISFSSAGTCTINANQAGNDAWNAAPQASQSFTVRAIAPDSPTIGAITAGNGSATVSFTAPAFTGGADIAVYHVTASPGGATASGSNSPLIIGGLTNGVSYTFTVTATNATLLTSAGSTASNAVVPQGPQTITFDNPGTQGFGSSPTLTASSSAGLGFPIAFTSATTGICTVTSGGVLTFLRTGNCTINANQAGGGAFLAAGEVSRTFNVAAVPPAAPTGVTAAAVDGQAVVGFSDPTFTGGAQIIDYTVTASPGGISVSSNLKIIIITGLTNGVSYTFKVTARNAAGRSVESIASTAVIPKKDQEITFSNPGRQDFGTTPTLQATSTSSLTPVFTSYTPGVCTITSNGTLSFLTVGSCQIAALQEGNAEYRAAVPNFQSFNVAAVLPGAPTSVYPTAGNGSATVYFSAPIFKGGVAISGYTVTASPGGITATGAGSPIVVSGLSNVTAYTFRVTATNSVGTGNQSGVSSAVTPNGPPSISGTPATSVNQDANYSFIPTATDVIGDVLTFSITNKPVWAAFNTATGALTGTPRNADVGVTSGIVISVTDGTYTTPLPAFNLSVVNVNDSPTITGTPAVTVRRGEVYTFGPTAVDIDGDVLTFSISNKPVWASFNTATGQLTGTPARGEEGTYPNVVISVSDGRLSAALTSFTIAVLPAPSITGITFTGATVVYDATIKSLAILGTLPTGANVSYLNNSQTNVGNYTVTANINGGVSYEDQTLTAQLTITKALLTGISFADGDFTYDGTAKSLLLTGTLPQGVTVTYTGNEQTEAGTYTVTANINGGANYEDQNLAAQLIITKAPLTGISFADGDFSYDGSAKSLLLTGTLPQGVTVTYTGNEQTEAGTYMVTANINGGNNYQNQTLRATLTIDRTTAPGISFAGASFVYDGTAKSLAITGTLPAGATVSYTGNGQTAAGTYTVTARITGGPNFSDQTLTANLTITKAVISGVSFSGASFVYDGTAKSLALTGTLPAGTTVSYTGNAQRNAGTHPVTATINGGANYQDQTFAAQLAIAKVRLTITANNASMCQGRSLPTFTLNYNGFIAGENESNLSAKPTVTSTATSSSAAGSYVITANGGLATNYELVYVNGTLTINSVPVVAINSNKGLTVAKGETVVLTATGGTSYVWANASGILSGQQTASLTVRPTANTTYSVTATNTSGCTTTQSVLISVTAETVEVNATNIMTLNGDGVNDKWVIANIDLYPNNEVTVYDIGNRVVYRKKGYDNSWDGTLRGLPLTRGTYYYIINFGDGKTTAKKGFITILGNK